MKKLLFSFLGIFLAFGSFSQSPYVSDALVFSKMDHLGTARFNSMGGSFGALGGDFSAINVNPAGLGIYRSSEFSFTPGFLFTNTEAEFRGNQMEDSRFNFNIGNIGYVGNYNNGNSGWKEYSFAVGYNRINNFSNRTTFSGISKANEQYLASSLIDDYVNDLNNVNIHPDDIYYSDRFAFGHSQAYDTYLFNPSDTNIYFYEREFLGDEPIEQKSSTITRGGVGETFFSFGGNYNDKFYLGALIGFQSLRYETERRYEETVLYDSQFPPDSSVLSNFVQNEELITSGLGLNFKLGMIYRLTDNFRIGGAIHTPTFYSLSEEYTVDIQSTFSDLKQYSVPEEDQAIRNYDYRLHTPFRFIGSLGWILGGKALVNLDYEYVNYSNMKLKESKSYGYASEDFSAENKEISDVYQGTHNLRLGTEYRLDPFTLRAGIRYDDNPYVNAVDADEKRFTYSIGAGFREKNFFLDAAFLFSKSDELNYPYRSVEVPANIQNKVNYFTITAGFRFE